MMPVNSLWMLLLLLRRQEVVPAFKLPHRARLCGQAYAIVYLHYTGSGSRA